MPDPSPPRHLDWGAESLWQALVPLLPGLSVEVVARCDSTNTVLLERARRCAGRHDTPPARPGEFDGLPPSQGEAAPFGRRADDTQACLLVAEHQERGRGRQGRPWQSSTVASLTFSLALPMAPRDWSGLSLAVGAAMADALDPAGRRIGLKWPNDLWLMDGPGAGRKLGGVLIETVAVGSRRMVVTGVGLNVQPQPVRELSSGYASLDELLPGVSAPQALHTVAPALAQALLSFEREGFGGFTQRYAARDLLAGRAITTTAPELPDGSAEGVGPDGALRVRAGGRLHLLSSGEVSVRLDESPGAVVT